MRLLAISLTLVLASCSGGRVRVSSIDEAPGLVRDGVIELSRESGLRNAGYKARVVRPPQRWISLDPSVDERGVWVECGLAPGDDDLFEPLGPVLFDTGYQGFLSLPMGHPMAGRVWLSDQLSPSPEDAKTMAPGTWWGGAAAGFLVGGIVTSPMPLVVSVWGVPKSWQSPLLGQRWVETVSAVWIDVNKQAIEVTYDDKAAQERVAERGGVLFEVPWIQAESGVRLLDVVVGERSHRTMIDTGSTHELLLFSTPPAELGSLNPEQAKTVTSKGFQPGMIGTVPVTLTVGPGVFDDVEISWFESPGSVPNQNSEVEAVLGVPFLQRGPVLLDMRQNRIVFFSGAD